ncbi:hypothetical protein BC940DRAFT_8415 [Gongronella butleri]|nr:hypothetical protein BC940DRAFT_8415 [Gongronella butleri]
MLVPLVVNLSSILVSYAFHTDAVLALDGKARKANAAARLLSRVFNTMLADRSGAENGRSKREGIISLINFTFKVYFKLDTVRMCQTMIANLQKSGVDIEQYPIGQQVTYQFYLGRYQFLQNRLRAAEKCLLFAFTRCHADYWHNKRLILKYLIPTRLLLGQFPSHNLLVTYDLHQQYAELIDALKTGNYARCIAVLEANFGFFYATAAYEFLLERLPVLLWRTALKKMHVLRCQMNNGAPNVLPLADCAMALQISMKHHEDVDADFVENVIVTLINQGYIKGYVHHRRQIAVVSKMNAFPKISNVHLTTEIYDEELEREHLAFMEEQDAMAMG